MTVSERLLARFENYMRAIDFVPEGERKNYSSKTHPHMFKPQVFYRNAHPADNTHGMSKSSGSTRYGRQSHKFGTDDPYLADQYATDPSHKTTAFYLRHPGKANLRKINGKGDFHNTVSDKETGGRGTNQIVHRSGDKDVVAFHKIKDPGPLYGKNNYSDDEDDIDWDNYEWDDSDDADVVAYKPNQRVDLTPAQQKRLR